jgi:uncharacterized protein (DUF1697 family)
VATRYAVLLRGINLGRARQVPMPELKALLEQRGHAAVRTHLRSGNVVLDSDLDEAALAADVRAAVGERFGFDVPTVVRTGEELARLVADDLLGDVATDPARRLVWFLAAAPAADRAAALPAPRGAGQVRLAGRELHVWMPDGMARDPLATTDWDRLLGVPGTGRNWNTVEALARLAA